MRQPKFVWKRGAFDEIRAIDPVAFSSKADVEWTIESSLQEAESMARIGAYILRRPISYRRIGDKRAVWLNDTDIVAFFGSGNLSRFSMKATSRRMDSVLDLLANKRLRIRLLPQHRGKSSETSGHNYGGLLSRRTFTLFPNWFRYINPDTLIHELCHDRMADQLVIDQGEVVTVYGERLAKLLAKKHPLLARISPTNYDEFCLAVQERG